MTVAPKPGGPPVAEVAVIGGSGFYELFEGATQHDVATPFGKPAAPITVGTIGSRRVAFLARHGIDHRYPPHRVPFRANVHALWSLGVRSIVAPCSVGSLQPDIHPGDLVVVDQLVDRTWGRPDTFHDEPPVRHQSFADPYDPGLRTALVAGARELDMVAHDGGTMVVINGPRFSTRAESMWFRSMGWHVVNMTGYPEAVLAAELGVRYASVALVTDYDAGVDGHEPVTMDAVLDMMRENVAQIRQLVEHVMPRLP